MVGIKKYLLVSWSLLLLPMSALATSLQVSPVLVNVPPPGAASKLVLRNRGTTKISAQIRIFKWIQKNGKDKLVHTTDVVASPPLVRISPDTTSIVRVIRTSKTPFEGEEAYRLIIDQLPAPLSARSNGIKLQMRYSIPVFFGSDQSAKPVLKWDVKKSGAQLHIRNSGKRHARISDLIVKTKNGRVMGSSKGLVGYVLSNSNANFNLGARKKVPKGSLLIIQANTRSQKINLTSRTR